MNLGEVCDLEEVLLAAWPAREVEIVDGWALSANNGVTGRANSLTVLRQPTGSVERALDAMQDWYRERNLVPMCRTTPLSGEALVALLGERGYGPHSAACDVMTVVVDDVDVRADVLIEPAPTDPWFERSSRRRGEWANFRAMFERVDGQVAYAEVRDGAEIVAIGQGVVVGDWLSVFNMNTAPAHRGNGHARAILGALHAWGMAHGTTAATLQVTLHNQMAQRLYRSVGYRSIYRYSYLRAPD